MSWVAVGVARARRSRSSSARLCATAALCSISYYIAAMLALRRFSLLVASCRRTANPSYALVASGCVAGGVAFSGVSTGVALTLMRGLLGRVAEPDTPVLGGTPAVEGLLVFFGAIARP
jgi:uncharacterized membrane protein YjfL (UPF0719 family)